MSEWRRKAVERWLDDIESGDAIAIIWTTEDVMSYCDVDEERAREILSYADRKHDAEYGICWETFAVINSMMDD